MTAPAPIQHGQTSRTDLEPEPIAPADIVEGDPVARSVKLSESRNGRVSSHIWECSAGSFRWHYFCDEVIHILDGEARIEDEDGKTFEISAGDVIQFALGSSASWTVPAYVRKVAFLSYPHPAVQFARRLRRAPAKLRRIVSR